mmetsp:Transcript_30907/g.56056  ORF Transcript_30907/g.56056 Transcript_30907/m.56056 type:complete len:211 (-) Transcript_30907:45-677(-)
MADSLLKSTGVEDGYLMSRSAVLIVGAGAAAVGLCVCAILADTRRQVSSLRQQVVRLQSRTAASDFERSFEGDAEQATELSRTKALIADAGTSLDRKLDEVKKEVAELRSEVSTSVGSRWPSRPMDDEVPLSARRRFDTEGSEAGSEAPSLANSTISAEESTELKKMRAVVAAAAKNFTLQLMDVRKSVKQLQARVQAQDALPSRWNEGS